MDLELIDPKSKSYVRQYPLSREDAWEAEFQIQDMTKQGLVDKSKDSSFNSPLFLVKKMGGRTRIVADFRMANMLLKPYILNLPRIETLMQAEM